MADKEKNFREKSYCEERAEEGLLFATWTQTWGVKIKPIYHQDKVRFSFIEKGSNGKGKSFNVDVPTKKDNVLDFCNFADEVLWSPDKPYRKCFIKVLQEEKAAGKQYPERYKWITGTDGEKTVGITNSQKGGYVINGNNTKTNTHVNIPICDTAIMDICEEFVRTYAPRKTKLNEILDKGITSAQEFFIKNKEQVDQDSNIVDDEPTIGSEASKTATPSTEAASKADETARHDNSEVAEASSTDWITEKHFYKTLAKIDSIPDGPKAGYCMVAVEIKKSKEDDEFKEGLLIFTPQFQEKNKKNFDAFVKTVNERAANGGSVDGYITTQTKDNNSFFAIEFNKA